MLCECEMDKVKERERELFLATLRGKILRELKRVDSNSEKGIYVKSNEKEIFYSRITLNTLACTHLFVYAKEFSTAY